jgi:hypothetical protein
MKSKGATLLILAIITTLTAVPALYMGSSDELVRVLCSITCIISGATLGIACFLSFYAFDSSKARASLLLLSCAYILYMGVSFCFGLKLPGVFTPVLS